MVHSYIKQTSSILFIVFFALQKYGIESIDHYNRLQNVNRLDWKGNDSSVTGKELYEKVTYSVEDVVDVIRVRLDTANPSTNESSVLINGTDLKDSLLAEHGHRKYGKCFAYQPKKPLLDLGVYYIRITM